MANYTQLVTKTREVFLSGRTREIKWRREQLKSMLRLVDDKRDDLCDMLYKDLHKHASESLLLEIEFVRNDLIDTINNLDEWSRPEKHKMEAAFMEVDFIRNDLIDTINSLDDWYQPEKVKKNLMTMMDEAYIQREPYGVALIMGAWNYPVQLTFGPMIGAIAAGNALILKPSELAENVANFLEKTIPQYMDKDCINVINGGIPETTALLQERFDYIFYTGNSQVARIIAAAAAKHLTPMTLELGGKSPCYVHPDSDIGVVARRLVWGKFTNAGQTCIAPDYVLCTKEVEGKLVEKLKSTLKSFYGEDPQKSQSLSRIVNNRHFNRVRGLLSGGETVIGGQMDEKDNYIAPTVVTGVKASDPVMVNEVFGPVLPIMTIKDENEAIDFINSREKPLAMYVFTHNKSVQKKIIDRTSSGGVCGNDCLMHCSLMTLPFGGVGDSGQGQYHGRFSYDTFSHKRSVLIKKQAMEMINDIRYPPYTEKKQRLANFVLKKKLKSNSIFDIWPLIVIGAILGFMAKYFKK